MQDSLTQNIEQYILELLGEDMNIRLRRKDLAERFECVPSQINYVLRSRFSPEQGYLIESRRGEHGYIRILRITCESAEEKRNHIEDILGESISFHEAARLLALLQERGFITDRERLLIEIALHQSDKLSYQALELSQRERERKNAELMKCMLKGLMTA